MIEPVPVPPPDVPASPVGLVSEGPRSELTIRAVIVGLFVAALVGGLYPYVVMKLGFGPTISVVAAFFAFIILNIIAAVTKRRTGASRAGALPLASAPSPDARRRRPVRHRVRVQAARLE